MVLRGSLGVNLKAGGCIIKDFYFRLNFNPPAPKLFKADFFLPKKTIFPQSFKKYYCPVILILGFFLSFKFDFGFQVSSFGIGF
ncbi:MAG: hypothetical protein B6D64_00175 [Bacteroidetes bacterium 4484_276]|nr:MAG: hypothetical protein B6D64_00175 [Bacteroidetes bacterium 4484_276]OYT14310.1 MAG: hypothetical protein B6I19_00450 [Bacteroidetes bacterium 4572_114]